MGFELTHTPHSRQSALSTHVQHRAGVLAQGLHSFSPHSLFFSVQDEFLSSMKDHYSDILFQLVQRTKEAVQQLDNQNYRRLQKMLMNTAEEGEEHAGENDEIESEPPR